MTDRREKFARLCQPGLAPLMLADQLFIPLLSGALYWVQEDALLVADLHLDKAKSLSKRGQFLPPYDTAMTLGWLMRDLMATRPKQVICLGDSFHRPDAMDELAPRDREGLNQLMGLVDWVWILGNHDDEGAAFRSLGGACVAFIERCGVRLVHEPVAHPSVPHIAGHLHPKARVKQPGGSVTRPCFIADPNQLILPAYGASTGGLDIGHEAFDVLDRAQARVIAKGKKRLYEVGDVALGRKRSA